MELTMLYVHGENIGYARYGLKLAEALERAGVTVYDDLAEENRPDHFVPVVGAKHKKTNVAAWVSTPSHAWGWWDTQVPVISTMWEATNLPESFRENLHNFDTVIVPSYHNVELFSRYHDNVQLVLLGVDPKDWYYRPRQVPDQFFNFLIGGSGPRKGTDLAYKAFRAAFPQERFDGPIPKLIMKNPRGEPWYGDRIEMVTGRISAVEEQDLYASAHCYLQPSRGEGFGLQPLQAIAQGCPTILTGAHGHESFAHLGYPIGWKYAEAAYFIYGNAGDWWEPDFDELVDQMRWVYNHYDEALVHAAESAAIVAEDWTWDNTARQFIDAIGPDKLSAPYQGTSTWVECDLARFAVMVNRPYTADIAGSKYQWKPGHVYWEAADVKRILFESGVLDPECLTMDDGLTEAQLEKVPNYTAAHSYCETCGQKLGSGLTREDEILLELERT